MEEDKGIIKSSAQSGDTSRESPNFPKPMFMNEIHSPTPEASGTDRGSTDRNTCKFRESDKNMSRRNSEIPPIDDEKCGTVATDKESELIKIPMDMIVEEVKEN